MPHPFPTTLTLTDGCGGPGMGGPCWCDSLCTGYGDCCFDFGTDCAIAKHVKKVPKSQTKARPNKFVSKAAIDVQARKYKATKKSIAKKDMVRA